MPNCNEVIKLNHEIDLNPEENKLDTKNQAVGELVIPDEVALTLGDIEKNKSPEEAFFLF